ncbi:MAG: type I methionyl aminopeptidase [Ignavibacteriae bacterium]|nr:type I methionyl aminopeptidase [Ignavibacteriota bacterium]
MSKALIKSPYEIELIRNSSRIVAEVLRLLGQIIRPGISTKELDSFAEDFIRSQDAVPAFKGYGFNKHNKFPASICASVDDQVVHGIPNDYHLKEGEIISIDVGVKKNNYFGDGAWTYQVGRISDAKLRLLRITEESLYEGIKQATNGNRVCDISQAVQTHVESNGYSVVRELVGHGVGRQLHEKPNIPNFTEKSPTMKLVPGMTIAIEPMVNAGAYDVFTDSDGWTVKTEDGFPSAHFEHTVLITENGAEILTV